MMPWYVIGPKVARIGRQLGQVTQAQFLTGRFGSRQLSLLIALISIVALIPYITLQMRGAGIVIEAVTEGHVPLCGWALPSPTASCWSTCWSAAWRRWGGPTRCRAYS
jgi:Na+/proline symporter